MRKINKSYFALFLLLSFSTIVISQDKKIDSLKKELSVHTGKDSIRVNILNELAYNYYLKDTRISR